MRNNLKELDVAFIGGQNKPLTREEQLAITAFITKLKAKRGISKKAKISKSKKQLV